MSKIRWLVLPNKEEALAAIKHINEVYKAMQPDDKNPFISQAPVAHASDGTYGFIGDAWAAETLGLSLQPGTGFDTPTPS